MGQYPSNVRLRPMRWLFTLLLVMVANASTLESRESQSRKFLGAIISSVKSAAKGAMAALGMTTGKPGEVREDKIGTMNRLMMPKVLGDFLEPQTPFKWSPGKAWASRDAPEWPNRDSPGSIPDGTGTYKFDRSGIFLLSELGQRATENGPAPMTEMQGPQDTRQPSSFFDPDLKQPYKFEGNLPLPGTTVSKAHAPQKPRPGPNGVQHFEFPKLPFDMDDDASTGQDKSKRVGPSPVEKMGPTPPCSDCLPVNERFKLPPHAQANDPFQDLKAPPE